MLKKYKGTVNKIKKDKEKLLKENTILTSYKKEQQHKVSSLQTAMKNKQKIAQQLESNEDLYEQSIDDLLKTSAEIESQLQKIQKNSTVKYVAGGFTWPTPGYYRINSPFGYRIHPIFHTRKLHTGLDIGASYGTAIRATHSGVVAMAGWYGGYGKAVIIDHGNGMASLYGHCSSLNVVVNQKVSAGDIIAYVGSTGNSTGPHLHFEIRQNGTPVNPFNYVK
jgi:murein DD-endopeptidase MepM/ murein hydrolase activator NlpD